MRKKLELASRTKYIRAGNITKLLKKAARRETLSLAGGHPALETLPVEQIKTINKDIFKKHGPQILQYGLSKGYPPLRQSLVKYVRKRGIRCGPEKIGISSGAQNAIDAVAKLFLNPGDKMVIPSPTFFYSIQTFQFYEPKILVVKTDRHGIVPADLEKICRKDKIKLVYIIPNFENPTGTTLPLERRKELVSIAKKYGVFIVEDDPYFELRYKGRDLPSLRALDTSATIYIGSFSKIFSPGMRLGYYIASKKLVDLITSARQVVDIHANKFAQAVACEYINKGYLEAHLPKIKSLYSKRLDAMLSALDKYVDKNKFSWSKPEGGLFVWLEGVSGFDAMKAYHEAVEKGVVFVPGKFFYRDEKKGQNTLRLNFTNLVEKKLDLAVKRLGQVINVK